MVLSAAALALLVAACGGAADANEGVASLNDSSFLDSVESAPAALTEEEALLAFTQCLRDNGVDVEDPTVDADGNLRLTRPNSPGQAEGQGPGEEFRGAREACSDLLAGVTLGFQDLDQTELQDQLLEFAVCMRDNGYEQMPDPDLSGFGTPGQGGRGVFGEIDRDDPDFQAAQEACEDILAGLPRGPGGGGRGGGPGNG